MDLNKKLEELKPYQLNCNVFDVYSYNGLSMQDLLCQFFTKINECITVSNETIDLAKWLVNEGLEIEVVKKLMIWLEDGTLENIINVNLFNTLNDKINGLSSQLEHIALLPEDLNIKQLIENASDGSTIKIPSGNYRIDESIIINKRVTITGDDKSSTILNFVNTDAFIISSDYVTIKNIRIYSTNTDNGEYIGCKISKEDTQITSVDFYNVTIDRFNIGVKTHRMWNFNWDNLSIGFVTKYGIQSTGLSVNNNITNSRIVADNSVKDGSIGLFFDGSKGHSEGWNICNTLIFGFHNNISSECMCHVQLINNILDFAKEKNILLRNKNNNVSGGWLISNNYMATNNGIANIHDANNVTVNNIAFGNTISNNKIHDYQKGTYGIIIDENAVKNIISGNRFTNFSSDITNQSKTTLIVNNTCLSNTTNITTVKDCLINSNIGSINSKTTYSLIRRTKIYDTNELPEDLTEYSNGDIFIYDAPSNNDGGIYRIVNTTSGKQLRHLSKPVFSGQLSWSLAQSADELEVTYPHTMNKGYIPNPVLTVQCNEDMRVTLKTGSVTSSGFTIKVVNKPESSNAIIRWIAY